MAEWARVPVPARAVDMVEVVLDALPDPAGQMTRIYVRGVWPRGAGIRPPLPEGGVRRTIPVYLWCEHLALTGFAYRTPRPDEPPPNAGALNHLYWM